MTLQHHRIAAWIIKYYGIVTLHIAKSRETVIGQFNPFEVTLGGLGERHGVVHKRKSQRRVGNFGTVGYLAHKKEIAHQQRFFHGRGGDGVGFEYKSADDRGCHHCKDDGIDPFAGYCLFNFWTLVGRDVSLVFVDPKPGQIEKRKQHRQRLVAQIEFTKGFGRFDNHQENHKNIDERNQQ